MTTLIRRLKLDMQFEMDDSISCFHTNGEVGDEPPTIIQYNGKEYGGTVELKRSDDEFTILIRMKQ